jgi:hypothetical protein
MREIFGVASLVVSIAANIPYIKEIIGGKVRPERVSWFLWTILGATYYLSAVYEDGATLFAFGELIGPITIFILSIKYGVGGKSKFDTYSLLVAMAAFILLFVLDGVLVSLLLALLVDAIGVTLTVRKLLIDPASESRNFWGLAGLASVLALLSLQTYTAETLLFPSYVLVVSIFIFLKTDPNHEKNVAEIEKL